ncbi:hypothetical protein AVEN_181755-1 [Araneus ventricosus]|uniref:Uncharacterized protein n=1 Tax=Araneus ventricosus TaxID=182803 RepID=A0A4Y2P241_ARAVE|nr:hypothetical protein AVEN_181755-1 [Araneus ventricosus]
MSDVPVCSNAGRGNSVNVLPDITLASVEILQQLSFTFRLSRVPRQGGANSIVLLISVSVLEILRDCLFAGRSTLECQCGKEVTLLEVLPDITLSHVSNVQHTIS